MKVLWRRIARVVTVVFALIVIVAGAVYAAAGRSLARTYTIPDHAPAEVAPDSAILARGSHLVGAIGKCAECHGDDLGGRIVVDDPALGRLSAPNLTRGAGSVTATFTMVDWERALRHGVAPGGRGLILMPSDDYAPMSDEDLAAVVAYLRQLPPVDREMPATTFRLLGRALYLSGRLPLVSAARIDSAVSHAPVPPGPTARYGAYLADLGGCRGCHGPNLSGGPIPGLPPDTPPAANLTPEGLGKYDQAEFTRLLREGVRPDGSRLRETMPVRFTRLMTDDEITAIYLFLQSVPPRPFGGR